LPISPISGHLWTIVPHFVRGLATARPLSTRVATVRVDDATLGDVQVRAHIDEVPGADALVVVVHGLGGSASSPYCVRAAAAIVAAGATCVRVDLRGADGSGEDVYHAGLCSDLDAVVRAIAAPEVRRVYALGFSLGGHVALRWGVAPGEPRLRAVAAVCAPLDLALGCASIDRPAAWAYRVHVLRGLKGMYREVARRRAVKTPVADVARVRTVRQWDERVVVVRHGFADVDAYYASQSVAPRLRALAVPSLWLGARDDPMVTESAVAPALDAAASALEVAWLPGGHVGFPPATRFGGEPIERGLAAWLLQR
jgi:predicted alpha/beta-fold hydrolase